MTINEIEYKSAREYAVYLMGSMTFCDPLDLVNDALVDLGMDVDMGILKGRIKGNFLTERARFNAMARFSNYEIQEDIIFVENQYRSLNDDNEKVCTKCKKNKPISEFHSYRDKRVVGMIFLHSNCKKCISDYQRERYLKLKNNIVYPENKKKYQRKYNKTYKHKNSVIRYINSDKGIETRSKYAKEYRINMTEEQKQKKKDRGKEYRKSAHAKELARNRQSKYREKKNNVNSI